MPVEKYFMATSPEQALEMFAYSCRSFPNTPELLDFGKWDRWTNEWTYEITKESAQDKFQSLSKSTGDEAHITLRDLTGDLRESFWQTQWENST